MARVVSAACWCVQLEKNKAQFRSVWMGWRVNTKNPCRSRPDWKTERRGAKLDWGAAVAIHVSTGWWLHVGWQEGTWLEGGGVIRTEVDSSWKCGATTWSGVLGCRCLFDLCKGAALYSNKPFPCLIEEKRAKWWKWRKGHLSADLNLIRASPRFTWPTQLNSDIYRRIQATLWK